MTKLIPIFFLLLSCSSSKTKNDKETTKIDTVSVGEVANTFPSPKDWMDSILIQTDTINIVVHNDVERFIQLTKNSNLKFSKKSRVNKSLAAQWGLDTSFIHYSYSQIIESKDETIKILSSGGTDYSALWLVSFDEKQKPIDKYEISGGECDGGWNGEGNRLCTCEFKMAIQVNDSTFLIRKVKECEENRNSKLEFVKLNKWIVYLNSEHKIVERGPAEHPY